MIRVFVLAEIRLYREGLAQILAQTGTIDVVGTAAHWADATGSLAECQPDVLLVDMTTRDSFATIGRIRSFSPPPRVVALAVPNGEDGVLACAQAGVSGYVTRDDSLDTMVAAIESVARGELLTTPRMAAVLFERLSSLTAERQPAETHRLTPREREIVELISEGQSNKAIAQRLQIEVPTVKNHVHSILEKLQVTRRGEAAARMRADRESIPIHSGD